jgi:FG-GAP repeat
MPATEPRLPCRAIRIPRAVPGRGALNIALTLLLSTTFAAAASAAEQTLRATDGKPFDQFGYSVGISGDTAVAGSIFNKVGTNEKQGAAYVFINSDGTWTEQAKLVDGDGAVDDELGLSVAISGGTVAVGSYKSDIGPNENQGSTCIFVRSGTTWTQQAKLTASDGAAGDLFGFSVAIDGDTVAIGAVSKNVGPFAGQGAAYVFVRSGGNWVQQASLRDEAGFTSDNFGRAVAISGDTLVVGADEYDVGANTNQGVAYVFVRNGSVWVEQAKLTAEDGVQYDRFGQAVAIFGDTIVVGSQAGLTGNTNQGAAYVFQRHDGVWTTQAKLIATDGVAYDSFGYSVALSGDTLAIGAFGVDIGPNALQGAVYVFTRNLGVWTQRSKLTAGDGRIYDDLGYSVGISGDDIVAGADYADVGSSVDQGVAYTFQASLPPPHLRAVRK